MKTIVNQIAILHTRDEIPGFIWLLRILAVLLGVVHTWAAAISYSMNADGISYLDIGDAYVRGDWEVAINSVWSPMYSWILGGVLRIVKPSMAYEFPLVHLVNFSIYILALICFEYLWRESRNYQQSTIATEGTAEWNIFPHWMWWGLGYAVFVFASLHLISIWSVTPDMLMSAFVYLAAGMLVSMRMGKQSWGLFIIFGMVLGLSYLAKAVMFPMSMLFLIICLVSTTNFRQRLPYVLIAALFFFLFSVPFIAIVSIHEGRFTFSDAGMLTYVRHINGVPYPHWQGEPPGSGIPTHPTRLIFLSPPIYEFGEPVGGTYPITYDPYYWYEGVTIRRDLSQQIDYTLFSLIYFFDLLFRQQSALLIGIITLYWVGRSKRLTLVDFPFRWGLVMIAMFAFAFYGSVNVIGRYIGVFIVLFWTDLLANIHVAREQQKRNLALFLGIIMIAFMAMNIVAINLAGYWNLSGKPDLHQEAVEDGVPPSWPGEVAQELHQLGVKPGENVAIIGYGFDSFWARLARVKIVSEMLGHQATDFWLGDEALQQEVLQAFAGTGAEAVVAEYVPEYARLDGWNRVGNSNFYIYIFSEQ